MIKSGTVMSVAKTSFRVRRCTRCGPSWYEAAAGHAGKAEMLVATRDPCAQALPTRRIPRTEPRRRA
jgi:hypothetical protein